MLLRVSDNGGEGQKSWALRTGTLFCKNGASFNRVHAHAVIARRRELVVVAKAHPATCKVVLDRACAGDDDDLCTLAHPDSRLMGPLEAMYLGVCVVIWRDRHVVLARLSDPASHGKRWCSGRDHTARAVGRIPAVPNEPVLYVLEKERTWENVIVDRTD